MSFEQFSDKELELAMDYLDGKINDIQLNFRLVQNHIEPERIEELMLKLRKSSKNFWIFSLLVLTLLGLVLICLLSLKGVVL